MIHEFRRYVTQPGRRNEWVIYMESVIIPFMLEKGMDVKGSFLDDEDPDAGRLEDRDRRRRVLSGGRQHGWLVGQQPDPMGQDEGQGARHQHVRERDPGVDARRQSVAPAEPLPNFPW
jgi:hypothetical protein